MIRRLTALLLIVALISSNCPALFLYAGFKLNRDYISHNLCVNKSRPIMLCNGKCFFAKEIRLARDHEKKQGAKDKLTKMEVSIQHSRVFLKVTLYARDLEKKPFAACLYRYTNRYIESLFRPPKSLTV